MAASSSSLIARSEAPLVLASPVSLADFAGLVDKPLRDNCPAIRVYQAWAVNGDAPRISHLGCKSSSAKTNSISAPEFCAHSAAQLLNYELVIGLARCEEGNGCKLNLVRVSDVWPKQWGKVQDYYARKFPTFTDKRGDYDHTLRLDHMLDTINLGSDLYDNPLHVEAGEGKRAVADTGRLWRKSAPIVHLRLVKRGCKHWQQMPFCECVAVSFAYSVEVRLLPPAEGDASSHSSGGGGGKKRKASPDSEALELIKKQNTALNERNEHLTAVLMQLATRYIEPQVTFAAEDKALLDAIAAITGGEAQEVPKAQ